jgi:hypothetical protein
MGTAKDIWDFERVNFGNIWDQIEDNPWRLVYGSVDPFSTELWNQILGEDNEPMVNMLGGPMGSGWAGLGENGGVYDLARDEGVNTKWSEKSHDVAEVIASIYGGSALGDVFGGLFGSGAGGAVGGSGAGGSSGAASAIGGGAPAGIETVTVVGSSGGAGGAIGGAAGGGAAAAGNGSAESGEDGWNWKDMLENQQGGGNQQQQQQSEPKKNAYQEFLENQNKARLVAQALAQSQSNQSDDFNAQAANQRQRRLIAQAMMG